MKPLPNVAIMIYEDNKNMLNFMVHVIQLQCDPLIAVHLQVSCICSSKVKHMLSTLVMWEEGMNTKPQIYYNNKHASTRQASKRKKASQMKTICTLGYREVENTHTK